MNRPRPALVSLSIVVVLLGCQSGTDRATGIRELQGAEADARAKISEFERHLLAIGRDRRQSLAGDDAAVLDAVVEAALGAAVAAHEVRHQGPSIVRRLEDAVEQELEGPLQRIMTSELFGAPGDFAGVANDCTTRLVDRINTLPGAVRDEVIAEIRLARALTLPVERVEYSRLRAAWRGYRASAARLRAVRSRSLAQPFR
jgi:hypothetical protein